MGPNTAACAHFFVCQKKMTQGKKQPMVYSWYLFSFSYQISVSSKTRKQRASLSLKWQFPEQSVLLWELFLTTFKNVITQAAQYLWKQPKFFSWNAIKIAYQIICHYGGWKTKLEEAGGKNTTHTNYSQEAILLQLAKPIEHNS